MSNQNIDIVINAIDNASEAIKNVSGGISWIEDTAKTATKSISNTMQKIKGSMQSASEKMQKIGAVWGVAFAGISMAINSSIQDASQLNNSLTGLRSIVEGMGGDFNKAKKVIQSFTADGLVTTEEAAVSLKNLIAKGFSLDQAEQMMLRFKDAASFGRQASLWLGEAIAGATEGIKNENSMLVDNAGVTKNVSVMVTEYAKALGIKENALTAAQRNEAVYQGILKETKFQVGDSAKLTESYSWQVAKLNATKTQLSQTIGNILLPAMTSFLSVISPAIQKVLQWTQENPKLAEAIIYWSLAVAWLTTAIGILWLALPAVITWFTWIAVAAKALWTALVFLATNPVWIILTALTALWLAAYTIYTNWDAIRPQLAMVWNQIKIDIATAVDGAKMAVFGAFDAIMTKVTSVTDWMGAKVGVVLDYARRIRDALESAGGSLYDIVNPSVDITGKRAFGGPVQAWRPVLVGERGPEIIIPQQSGTVIPNNAINGWSPTVNVSFWNVTVKNESDIQSLAKAVWNELARTLQLYKQWIS